MMEEARPLPPVNEQSGTQNKINLKWSNWSDNTPPPIVKHVLAPKNEFGMHKHLVKLQKNP